MASSVRSGRPYDLVLFGATGFTGQRVARYLADAAPPTLRWAIAGRNAARLEALKARLAANDGRRPPIGVLHAAIDDPDDPDDADTLRQMAASGRVLLNTAGPFLLHGEPVVRACVDAETDYADLSGEAGFVRRIEASLAEAAARKGVRLVPCCGFEAIVADLGVLHAIERLAPVDEPVEIRAYVRVGGGLSGGSLQTALNALGDLGNAMLPPPNPANTAHGRKVRSLRPSFGKHAPLDGWVAPMRTIDHDIVLRSAAALPAYGRDFGYAHHVVFPGLGQMLTVAGRIAAMALCAQWPATRRWLQARLRQPGEGPSEEEIAQGWFNVRFEARCGHRRLVTEVSGGDPGYGDTAKMLAQAGLCLLDDAEARHPGGLLTPAQAMGPALIGRLDDAGIRFRVLE